MRTMIHVCFVLFALGLLVIDCTAQTAHARRIGPDSSGMQRVGALDIARSVDGAVRLLVTANGQLGVREFERWEVRRPSIDNGWDVIRSTPIAAWWLPWSVDTILVAFDHTSKMINEPFRVVFAWNWRKGLRVGPGGSGSAGIVAFDQPSLAICGSATRRLFLGDLDLWESRDSGIIWKRVENAGLDNGRHFLRCIGSVVDRPETVTFLGSDFGEVFNESSDLGTTWSTTAIPPVIGTPVRTMHGAGDVRLVLGSTSPGAYGTATMLRRDGATGVWELVHQWHARGAAFAVLAVRPAHVVAATDSLICWSNDTGRTWRQLAHDIPTKGVSGVSLDPVAGTVYIATCDTGVWVLETPLAGDGPSAPEEPYLGVPYPSPASAQFTVLVSLPTATSLHLGLHDALGREVRREERPDAAAGTSSISFDVSSLPCGLYFLRSDANGSTTRVIQVYR